jgi:hypothetical protein
MIRFILSEALAAICFVIFVVGMLVIFAALG